MMMNASTSTQSLISAAAATSEEFARRRKRTPGTSAAEAGGPSSPPEPDSVGNHVAGSPPLPGSGHPAGAMAGGGRPAFLSSSLSRLTGVIGDADVDQLRAALASGWTLNGVMDSATLLSAIATSTTSPSQPTPACTGSKKQQHQLLHTSGGPTLGGHGGSATSVRTPPGRARSSSGGSTRLVRPQPSGALPHGHGGFVPFPGDAPPERYQQVQHAHEQPNYPPSFWQHHYQQQMAQERRFQMYQQQYLSAERDSVASSQLRPPSPYTPKPSASEPASYFHCHHQSPQQQQQQSLFFVSQPVGQVRRAQPLVHSASCIPLGTGLSDVAPIRRAVSADALTASSIEREDMWEEEEDTAPQSKRQRTRAPMAVRRIRLPQPPREVDDMDRARSSPSTEASPPASPSGSGKRSDIYGLLN